MEDLYKALIGGKSQTYYLSFFSHHDNQGPGPKPGWNWAAFAFSGFWALYRKMYVWFFVLWGFAVAASFLSKDSSNEFALMVILVPWIAFAVYANELYYRMIRKKIASAREAVQEASLLREFLLKKGGVHIWVPWFFGGLTTFGFVAAIAIPMIYDKTTNKSATTRSRKPPVNWSEFTPTQIPDDKSNFQPFDMGDSRLAQPNTAFDDFMKSDAKKKELQVADAEMRKQLADVEAAHSNWERLVKTAEFSAWLKNSRSL